MSDTRLSLLQNELRISPSYRVEHDVELSSLAFVSTKEVLDFNKLLNHQHFSKYFIKYLSSVDLARFSQTSNANKRISETNKFFEQIAWFHKYTKQLDREEFNILPRNRIKSGALSTLCAVGTGAGSYAVGGITAKGCCIATTACGFGGCCWSTGMGVATGALGWASVGFIGCARITFQDIYRNTPARDNEHIQFRHCYVSSSPAIVVELQNRCEQIEFKDTYFPRESVIDNNVTVSDIRRSVTNARHHAIGLFKAMDPKIESGNVLVSPASRL